jgi:ParB family transcriptional regulator, chromosome partitioning protein
MAKRKRLSFDGLGLETKSMPAPPPFMGQGGPSRSAPIAQVASDAAASAALQALTAELEEARASGRLILRLALDQIDAAHLTRDRLRAGAEEMEDLIASLRARGQQMPIEVSALEDGRFGLISGWRRLQALRHLSDETGAPEFASVLAIVRAPETLAHAYRAMVEENEIRAGISYYERARIAALAAEAGVYPDARAAIAGLFAAASRAKRSKIASFLLIWQHLDARLRFGPAISERLGLALAKAIDADPDFARRLSDRLRKAQLETAAEEVALLEKALAGKDMGAPAGPVSGPPADPVVAPVSAPAQPQATHREEISPGIWLETSGGFSQATLVLSGPRVDGPLRGRLVEWLRSQGRG